MPFPDSKQVRAPDAQSWFATTHWSVVLAAGDAASGNGHEALEKLCAAYWYPLYAFVRREGYAPADAQDLTQGFFARVLEKNYFAQVDRRRGKFRSFLLASLRHYICDEYDRTRALKRGGGAPAISWDEKSAEERYALEPADEMDAERIFERRWALTVLEEARKRLRMECAESGKADLYEQLKSFLSGETSTRTYAEVAARLGMSESAVKSAVPRLRRRYQELVREEIAHTVNSQTEVDEEIRHLIAVIGG
jgi:RNA polymerase sigma-70 factor (ECF subfamily)